MERSEGNQNELDLGVAEEALSSAISDEAAWESIDDDLIGEPSALQQTETDNLEVSSEQEVQLDGLTADAQPADIEAAEESAEESVADADSQSPGSEEPQSDIDKVLERIQSLEKRMVQQASASELNNLNWQNPPRPAEPPQAPKPVDIKNALSKITEDYPELGDALNQVISPLQERIQSQQSEIAALSSGQNAISLDREAQILEKVRPDYRQTIREEGFSTWLNGSSREVQELWLNNEQAINSAGQVKMLLDLWDHHKFTNSPAQGLAKAATSAATPVKPAAHPLRSKQLSTARSTKKGTAVAPKLTSEFSLTDEQAFDLVDDTLLS